MIELDQALFDRMKAAFVKKAQGLPRDGYTDEEWLQGIVGDVIVDTSFVLSGSVPLEAWEDC